MVNEPHKATQKWLNQRTLAKVSFNYKLVIHQQDVFQYILQQGSQRSRPARQSSQVDPLGGLAYFTN